MARIPNSVLEWLTQEDQPSLRYRTLTGILQLEGDHPDVKQAMAAIVSSPDVYRAFSAMGKDGSWACGKRTNISHEIASLNYLAELGLDSSDGRVSLGVEYLLSQQKDDGDFHRHYSCFNGLALRALVLLGYGQDYRVRRLKDLLLASGRYDGGYHCDINVKGRKNYTDHKSCMKGSLKVLLAFSEIPDVWEHDSCVGLIRYFMGRHVCFRTDDPERLVMPAIGKASFPFTYGPGLLEAVYSLAKMGYGMRSEMTEAWALLEQHRLPDGRYILRVGPTWQHLAAGPKNKPNKWATLYAYLSLLYREQGPASRMQPTADGPA